MSNYDDIKLLIKHTTGQENVLAVNKVYMKYMGSLEGGVLLSQLIYYSDKSSRKDGFFWKSYKEWYEETFISEHNIKKIVSKMKELGFLETKLIKANAAPTLHYKIDMDKFTEVFIPFLKILRIDSENIKNRNLKYSESITKITTEITNKEKDLKDNAQQVALVSEWEKDFDEFWSYYPKKTDKAKAKLKYKAKHKKDGKDNILNGLLMYMKEIAIKNTEKQFIKNPTTFLNAESYLNEFDLTVNEQKNYNNKYQKQDAMSLMLDKFENGGFGNEQREDEPRVNRILIP